MCELNSALLSEREVATAGAVARVVYSVFEVIVMVFFFFEVAFEIISSFLSRSWLGNYKWDLS